MDTNKSYNAEITGIITGNQRFSIHDGPGIRTLVFLKGCPLSCLWCHNPETQRYLPEIMYDAVKCIGCGECAQVCPQGCHRMSDGLHYFDRTRCNDCGRCTDVCPSALERCGERVTVSEALKPVLADRPFYKREGGLTLSGGEPFAQPEFALAILQKAKDEGIHTAVETCGACNSEALLASIPYVDLFLYDIKEIDPIRHKELVGADNTLIIKNLTMLSDAGATIVLRIPVIPGANDSFERFSGVGQLAEKLSGVISVDVLPYHRAGNVKYGKLGLEATEYRVPDKNDGRLYVDAISKFTSKPVNLR